MDAGQYAESDYVTKELVKSSNTKKGVITGDSIEKRGKYGAQLEIPLEFDGRPKKYNPNKHSLRNIISACGAETKLWVGKTLIFNIIVEDGAERILAVVDKNIGVDK